MVMKGMSKVELLARIMEDGHLLVDGTETRAELSEAFAGLMKPHACACAIHLYTRREKDSIISQSLGSSTSKSEHYTVY